MKWFSRQSAFYKMLLFIMLICICFFVIGLLNNRYSAGVLAGRVMDQMDEKAMVWKNHLEQQVNSLLLAQSNLVNDPTVLEVNVLWEQMDSYDRVETVTKLSKRLREIKILHSIVSDIKIYFQEHDTLISNDNPIMDTYETDEFYNYEQMRVTEEGEIVLTTYFPLRIQDNAKRKSSYYVRTRITPQKLKSQLEIGVRKEGGILMLLDTGGNLVAGSQSMRGENRPLSIEGTGSGEADGKENGGGKEEAVRKEEAAVRKEEPTAVRKEEEGFENLIWMVEQEIQGRTSTEDFRVMDGAVAACTYSSQMNLWMVYCYPEDLIQEPLQFFGVLNIALSVLVVLLFLAYAWYSSRTFARPLNRIMEAMEKQKDSFFIEERKDEFTLIYSRYNQMIMNTNKLMREKLEAEYQSKMSELRQLQYQIQPHFLYNSIFTIYRMAQLEENEDISEYTKHLGLYYQYITKSNDRYVMVSQEIEYLKNYLYIQKTRFGDRIEVVMDPVSEEVMKLEIAPLLLQPLVENAYEHGLNEMVSGGWLHISASYKEDIFCFQVEDNGCGVTDEQLLQIRKDLDREEINTDVIHGLTNINVRIHLIYGMDCGITVDRRQEGGFRAMLRLSLKNG